jgi:hypothetical protein
MTGKGDIGSTLIVLFVLSALLFGCASSDHESSTGGPKSQVLTSETSGTLPRCPKRGLRALEDRNGAARRQFVPQGSVSARICRFVHKGIGSGGTQPSLTEAALGSRGEVMRLKNAVSSLPPAPKGEFACPPGYPLNYLLIFGYHEEPPVFVRISYFGCGFVRNGVSRSVYQPTPGLKMLLNRALAEARS